jgi:glycosyltransferase involved in cell wall biosynthesis
MLKVLLSAFACEPGRGSELKIGWQWARQAARFHQVYVLTDLRRRASIEAELSRAPIPNLHFVYHSLPGWLRMPWPSIAGEYLYGLLWQLTAIPLCRRLHREIKFDLAHHVTIVSYQYPSCLAWVPCPFVWGPVGGCLRAPIAFYPSFGVRGMWYEIGRDVFNFFVMRSPLVVWTMWRADCIVPTTEFSKARLPAWAYPKTIVVRGEGVAAGAMPIRPPRTQGVKVLWVGRLLHWKGVHLAIQAFAEYLKWDPEARFTINMDGPDRRRLQQLVARLNLSEKVRFDASTVEAVEQLYDSHDVLLLPSLHDSGSFVALEAMSRGLPVICFESGGPAHSVTDEVGIRVKPVTPRQAVADMAAALRRLGADPALRHRMGEAGRRRVKEEFQWDSKGDFLSNLYPVVASRRAIPRRTFAHLLERLRPSDQRLSPAGGVSSAGELARLQNSGRTRVLLSAYSCGPALGSEPGIGWNTAREIAEHHDVWVLTAEWHRKEVEAALRDDPVPSLHFVFVDCPRWLRSVLRGRLRELHYYGWQLVACIKARALHARVGFDIAHHVTFARYWTPTFVAFLPIPLVWGPVGGGESAPRSFWRGLGLRGFLFEILREGARFLGEHDPALRASARRAALAFATTRESELRLKKLGVPRVETLTNASLAQEDLDALRCLEPPPAAPIRFMSAGRLLAWKGFHLALSGFARMNDPLAEYWIIGSGPERRALERQARQLGVANRVKFVGNLPRSRMFSLLGQCHALVHPSLHDSSGMVCVEAMAAGRPVICLDLGGPAHLVAQGCGFRVRATDPDETIAGLADAMNRLAGSPAVREEMGRAARKHATREFSSRTRGQLLSDVYAQLIAARDSTFSPAAGARQTVDGNQTAIAPHDLSASTGQRPLAPVMSDPAAGVPDSGIMHSARTVEEPHVY